MAADDETREAADGTEVQVEAVDLGTVHFEAHPEAKLPSIMEIKNAGETIESTEGTFKIPEDQVLVEAPSELELPQEHELNGKASSLNGHMGKEEKISSAQLHDNDQEEAELDGTSAHQSNGINKEEVIDCLSHGESTTEDSSLLKHEKDEERRDDRQDSEGVTVDDDLVQEDTLKTGNSVEQTDDGQKDQNQEPEKANDDTQPVSITNIANVEEAEAPNGFQTPVEPHLDDSGAVPVTINEKIEMEEPAKADDVVHPDHKDSFPEETSIAGPTEEVVKVEDQQSQESHTMDADVVQEEILKSEETHVQEELPKSEAHEPMINAQEMLNKESAEAIDAMSENNEETAHQSNMEAPKETTPELDTTMREPPVNVQVQNHEQSEEIEHAEAVDTEAEMEQRSVDFKDAILENQHNLGVTVDNDTVQEDTLKAIEQKDDGQQDQDLETEKVTEDTQPASTENSTDVEVVAEAQPASTANSTDVEVVAEAQPASTANSTDVEVVAEAPSGVQTPAEPSLDNSDTIPDTIDGNKETDEPAKADGVVHPDHKESSPEDASIAEPTEKVAKMEDPQSQQADAVDADVVQEEVSKFEHGDESATNAHEVLTQESTEETDGPVDEKTEETAHQSNMAVPEETTPGNDTITGEPPVNIQVQNQESVEKIEDAEEVDTGAAIQQSSAAFDEAVPEDQHNLNITTDDDTVQQDTLEATEQTEDPQGQDLEPEKANENTEPTTMTSIPDVEVVSEAPSGVQTPVEINLDNSDAIPDTADRNTETDESAKAEGTTAISEPQMTETEEEPKDNEATEAQEITQHGHVTPSKELSAEDDSTEDETHNDDIQQTLGQDSVEVKETDFTSEDIVLDNVTAEELTCDSQEVDNAESTKESKGSTAENTEEVSGPVIVDEAVTEQDVLQTEDIAATHMRELEPEETKNTEPVESEEASDQRNAVPFNDLAQEDAPESEMQQTESATEITETEAAPQESKDSVSEEPSLEDHKIENEKDCDTQGVSITESLVSAEESAQENDIPESNPTADIQLVQELELEEIKNTELTEVKETSNEINTTVFQTPTEEDNLATIDLHESAGELSNIEATEAGTPRQSDAAQSEEQAPEGIASEPQVLEPGSVEEMNATTATEIANISKGKLISSSEESVPEEIATEDNTSTKPGVDHQQVLDQESTDFMETEADKPPGTASPCIVSTSEQSASEENATAIAIAKDNAAAMEPNSDTPENLQPAEVTEGTEIVKSNTALAEVEAPEENVETGVTADMPSVQEPELEETKDAEPAGTEDIMTSSDLQAGNMDMETMGTEAVPHESHVESTNELTEDATEPVLELESSENKKCTDTVEHPGEPHGSTPTEENTTVTEQAFDTQQVQNLTSQEIKDSEDAKTDEFSDLSSFPTEEADQESNLPRTEAATEVLQVQELGSTEETRDIESEGIKQHGVSTFEEPAVDSEPNVDDQQVHEDKVPEVKDNEAMEAGEVVQQSNIDIPDDATEERNELTSDPDSYVQPAQHVDSENSQLEKAEETAGTVTVEETPTEDSTASEIDPPVDIKQEYELEPVEEIKGTDANEAEEEFHTTQVDAIEKLASEGDMASIEPTSDIKQENELEATKEINGIEAVNDGEQAENATSEDPSPADNDTTPEGHSTELNEEIMGNESDNVKDEIQTSVELKDGACDLGEAVLPTQGNENMTPKDEETENQKEEIQADEQKHEDKGGDFTMEPLVECKDVENGTNNRIEDTDVCEAEQTEAHITEILKHEEAPLVSEESTPSSTDMEVDNVKGTDGGTEEDAGAKNDNKDEKESEENDDIVAKDSTAEHDETIYEITNEEVEPSLASSGQEASEPAPSNDAILENNPAAVTQNVESGEHREDKECTDKVNDDVHTIQTSEEEIAGETNENKEIQNEDNAIHHDESQTKSEKDEVPQLHAKESCNTNAKTDDTTAPGAKSIDSNAIINPREVEEIGENKGLDSTSEPFVESSIQNNVEQDLSRHHKVEDENLSMREQNDVDIEATQEKADESASDINLTKQCQEEISKDDGQQLEIEENSFDKIDETISHEKTETSTTEAGTVNDTITNKASGDDGRPSDGSLKTFNHTGRDLDVSSVITASKEESVNENIEDHKLEKTEREMPSSEKLLPTEPEENQIPNKINEEEAQDENQVTSEKNEEDIQDTETGDAQNDVEQELPVSNFLMNLILGKKNGAADENSEPEAEGKQGETTEDDSFVLISKEEIVGPLCTENKVDENLTFEQENHDAKCSEETQEMVKEPSDDPKMDIERSIHTDEESNNNTRGNPQEKISDELLLSEEASSVSTNMKARDIEISNFELHDKEVDTICQKNSEDSTRTENVSLKSNINDLTNTETSEEGILGEQQTGLLHESLPEDNSADAVSAPLLVEPGAVDAKDSSYDAEAAQNLTCAKEDDPTESSIIETTSTPHIQLECEEVVKKEEEQHSSKDTENVPEEAVESSNDNPQKSTSSEVTPDEQAPHITEPVSDTEKILVHEKEICEGSTYMDERENFSTEGVENFQTAVETQADGANMQINQDKKNEIAGNETAMGPEKLGEYNFQQQQETDRKHEVADNKTAMGPEKLGESDFQEHQETDTEQKSPKVSDEGGQQFLVKKETVIKEQVAPETVESHEQTISNEKPELLDSKVQERALNVVSPREASEAEENFVDVTKQEFSTDEEQSPKADADEKTYDEKIKVVEGTQDFTDGAVTKTEAPGATQKASKKLKLLSGVGSKVKHQLAKVKKAIVGKPGNTKPDSPKS